MTSATPIGESIARRAAAALKEIHITAAFRGTALGLAFDELGPVYQVMVFIDSVPGGPPVSEFPDETRFTRWLAGQSDESLATLAASLAADCAPLSRDVLIKAVEAFERRATAAIPGRYRVEHPRGGLYSVPPLHFACLIKDEALFARALAKSSRETRSHPAAEGKNALACACASGFVAGARKLLDLDGLCCRNERVCACLKAALESEAWAATEAFRGRIRDQDDFVRAVPTWTAPEKRRELATRLGIASVARAAFLNAILERDDPYLMRSLVLRELACFPETDLNERDAGGWTPFLKTLAIHEIDESLLKAFLRNGADASDRLDGGVSALDLIRANPRVSPGGRRKLAHALYDRGARSTASSAWRRWWVNALSKRGL